MTTSDNKASLRTFLVSVRLPSEGYSERLVVVRAETPEQAKAAALAEYASYLEARIESAEDA